MQSSKSVLVLGASGGIGGEVARQLRDAGWGVRGLKRGLAQASEAREGITWLSGDAMNREEVIAAAKGTSVIVHAVNPPGYRGWAELVLPMIDNTIAAAATAGATIVLPGTVYNYGPQAFPVLTEASAQDPLTRKGAIRVEMERRLRAFSNDGGHVIIVRTGDYFGPGGTANNWFSQGLVKPGKPVGGLRYPGRPGVGHQWAYLPDVARTMVELLERRDSLEAFSSFHMGGHWDADGTQMAEAIRSTVERRTEARPKLRSFPWALLMLLSPFVVTLREMREMRYLWEQPLRMDNARLVATLGREPHTALNHAVEATLVGQGCLPQAKAFSGR